MRGMTYRRSISLLSCISSPISLGLRNSRESVIENAELSSSGPEFQSAVVTHESLEALERASGKYYSQEPAKRYLHFTRGHVLALIRGSAPR